MERRTFDDPIFPAYFKAAGKPFTITPQRQQLSGRIEFLVIGEGIETALEELFTNPQVGILDFIRELRSFRSTIFTLKGGRVKL